MNYRQIALFLFFIWNFSVHVISQTDFYSTDSIHEIKLYFTQPNWDELLDNLYVEGEEGRLSADVEIDGSYYTGVGVRYKGYSSFSTNRDKNPFNIDMDYTVSTQDHLGINKLKLSNVIQDPSFVREVLSYEIARKYMPASKANFANVYVNDTLIGLYTNVQAVNKDFLEAHFGSRTSAFFKCNPASLQLNGENSNLSNTPGTAVTNYYPFYDLKSDDVNHWDELYMLISGLNSSVDISGILNVDRTLWMHAFNYSVINFDSYVGYAQNYYLYKDESGRFNPILWDLNMSFASYRLSDASDNWDGFSIAEAKTIDPLGHLYSVSVQPRPLMRKLFENDTYRRMYMAHIRTMVEENFLSGDYFTRGQELQADIATSVTNDTNKFYSNAAFATNLTSTVSDLVDYPGIKDLMDNRAVYLSNYPGFQGSPIISNVAVYPSVTNSGDNVSFLAQVDQLNADVYLAYRYSRNEAFHILPMSDDGNANDGSAGDGIFGANVNDISNLVEYYFYAENDSAGRFSPERAAYEFYTLESKISFKDLVINEVQALNVFTAVDNFNQNEDWIELFNNTSHQLTTTGLFMTDDKTDLTKWALPSMTIAPGAYAIIWADDHVNQGADHANFKLNSAGDSLWLAYADSTIVDSLVFGTQYAYSSCGRYPNGTGDFRELIPTFKQRNQLSDAAVLSDAIFLFPNPASEEVNIRVNTNETVEMTLFSLDGKTVISTFQQEGMGQITLDTSQFPQGMYLIHLKIGETETIKKIAIYH